MTLVGAEGDVIAVGQARAGEIKSEESDIGREEDKSSVIGISTATAVAMAVNDAGKRMRWEGRRHVMGAFQSMTASINKVDVLANEVPSAKTELFVP